MDQRLWSVFSMNVPVSLDHMEQVGQELLQQARPLDALLSIESSALASTQSIAHAEQLLRDEGWFGWGRHFIND
jgi:DNA mismatch repair protein MutH